MILYLTEHKRIKMDHNAFTMIEMVIAIAFSVLLMAGVYGFYNAASQDYSSGIAGETLQDGTNIMLTKISEGETEAGMIYRLSTSTSYTVACTSGCGLNPIALYSCGGAPQNAPCNANDLYSEIYFCQDAPAICNYADPTARWYYLNSTGTSVIYHHFNNSGTPVEETIYTAPAGSTLTLRFSPPLLGSPGAPSATVVEIDAALNQTLSANIGATNNRLFTSGTLSTYILLRNHP